MSARAEGIGPTGDAAEPFVETRAGGLFFLNAVLASPALIVLFPLALRGLLRVVGALDRPSRFLDPIPMVAAYAGHWIAWLSLVPLVLCVRNLRMTLPAPARGALVAFALIHVGVLAWWVWSVAS